MHKLRTADLANTGLCKIERLSEAAITEAKPFLPLLGSLTGRTFD